MVKVLHLNVDFLPSLILKDNNQLIYELNCRQPLSVCIFFYLFQKFHIYFMNMQIRYFAYLIFNFKCYVFALIWYKVWYSWEISSYSLSNF